MHFRYYRVKSTQFVGWVSPGVGWASQDWGGYLKGWGGYLKRVKSFRVCISKCEIHSRGGYLEGWDGYLK